MSAKRNRPSLDLIIPAGILLVALLIRLPAMDHRLLPDEGYTWLVASAGGTGDFLHRLATFENTPALYYLLAGALPLNDEPWLRLPALIAGLAAVVLVYAIARPSLGRRTALVATLGVAVAPYAVATSNFARGFMLADAGLLAALLGAVRIAEGRPGRKWWLCYAAGAVVAIYSEYDAVTTLAPIALGLAARARPPRWRTLALAGSPAVAFLPWLHEFARSLNAVDVTKTGGGYLRVTPDAIRNQLATLFLGSSGHDASGAVKWLAVVVLAAGLAAGVLALKRDGEPARPLLVLLGWSGLGTFALHLLAPAAGIGIFDVAYLTFLIPVGAIVLARAVGAVPIRAAMLGATLALLGVGAGLAVRRLTHEPEPDPHAIGQIVGRWQAGTVLTNSAVIAYYLRSMHPILDRAFNLGPGLERSCSGCAPPIVIVDDTGVAGGARPGPGQVIHVGHYELRRTPAGTG